MGGLRNSPLASLLTLLTRGISVRDDQVRGGNPTAGSVIMGYSSSQKVNEGPILE